MTLRLVPPLPPEEDGQLFGGYSGQATPSGVANLYSARPLMCRRWLNIIRRGWKGSGSLRLRLFVSCCHEDCGLCAQIREWFRDGALDPDEPQIDMLRLVVPEMGDR